MWHSHFWIYSVILLTIGCFIDCQFVPGYRVVPNSYYEDSSGFSAKLALLPNSGSPYGSDFSVLNLQVNYVTEQIVRILLTPSDTKRWKVPEEILKGPAARKLVNDTSNLLYQVTITHEPFSLAVIRRENGEIFFNSSQTITPEYNGLIFSEQYIEWSTQITSTPYIYGLGERVDSFLLDASDNSAPFAIWNRDQGAARQKLNLYGSHPMYLRMNSETSTAHGVFMLNSNAMNVLLRPTYLTWKMIGGVIDMFVLIPNLSGTPEQVVELYTSVVGRPFLPSYYSLGRHQCRWGYKTIEETQQIVEQYSLHQIPLDTMWNDIDYMQEYLDFTTDPDRYPLDQVKSFIDYLHQNDQHYFIIIDPGISIQSDYQPYIDGLQQNVFIMTWNHSSPIEGKVWPGVTVFPDFYSPSATSYWHQQLAKFYQSGVEFDGLWADMSEPSSYCNGACGNTSNAYPPHDLLDNPPYNPIKAPLNTSTISMSAQSYHGEEYNTHNLYGYSETRATYLALKQIHANKRPFVLPRSTFISSGYYGAHWLGDNFSTWTYLKNSIAGVLSFQLFGIPMVGADICGFNGETTDELCSRWEQLGAFYPFSRNHNAILMRSQEPFALSTQHLLITKDAIRLRYLLLPYFYSFMFQAHANGTTMWRPLFFSFPNDSTTYSIDQQFLVGNALLVTPVLTQGADSVKGYFPSGIWYDFYSGASLTSTSNTGSWITVNAPIQSIPVHLYEGTIVPIQSPGLTTAASRKNPFELLIQISPNQSGAQGFLILDDGETLDTFENLAYTHLLFFVQINSSTGDSTLYSEILVDGYHPSNPPLLGSIRISGQSNKPQQVIVNGRSISSFTYDHETNLLKISGLLIPLLELFTISWN